MTNKKNNIIPMIRDKRLRDEFRKDRDLAKERIDSATFNLIQQLHEASRQIDERIDKINAFLTEEEYRLKQRRLEEDRAKSNKHVTRDYNLLGNRSQRDDDERD